MLSSKGPSQRGGEIFHMGAIGGARGCSQGPGPSRRPGARRAGEDRVRASPQARSQGAWTPTQSGRQGTCTQTPCLSSAGFLLNLDPKLLCKE